jgi:hypothetical protein
MKKMIIISVLLSCLLQASSQNQITITGNMKLHPGTAMTIFGNFNNNGNFSDTGQVVNFSGTSNQVISGTSISTFKNCVVNNTNGISLQRSVNIANTLTLTAGGVFLQSNTLTIQNSSTSAISRSTGYIVSEQTNNTGILAWILNSTTGPHIFPFATNTGTYIPFTLDLTSGNIGTVSLATYPTNISNFPYPSNPDLVTHVNNALGVDNSINTVDRFWQIIKTGISGTANITFKATGSEVGSITNLQAYRWNSSTQGWETPPGAQSNGALSVTVQNVSTFSPWTLAGNDSPLPVELLSFTATLNEEKQVDLDWTTATEINSDYFVVERSTDAVHFEEVLTKTAAGNSNVIKDYHDMDPRPYIGTSYYRLKQVDLNGDFYYSQSDVVFVGGANQMQMTVYPNPGNNENVFVRIAGASDTEFLLNITDMSGKVESSKWIKAEGDSYTFRLSDIATLSPGIYTVRLISKNDQLISKLCIQ